MLRKTEAPRAGGTARGAGDVDLASERVATPSSAAEATALGPLCGPAPKSVIERILAAVHEHGVVALYHGLPTEGEIAPEPVAVVLRSDDFLDLAEQFFDGAVGAEPVDLSEERNDE